MTYLVHRTSAAPALNANWAAASWAVAELIEVSQFRPESSDHRPATQARLLYDEHGIHGIFRVQDRFVRCVRAEYGSQVWKDSCVEFFAQPKPDRGYFNLEMNCGGTFLCWYITDPTRTPEAFKAFTRLPPEIGRQIQVRSSLPCIVDPEIAEPVTWALQFFVPFTVFENFVGPLGKVSSQIWLANFFKCGDETSHPHWASWSPVDEFNFHLPHCFGELRFG